MYSLAFVRRLSANFLGAPFKETKVMCPEYGWWQDLGCFVLEKQLSPWSYYRLVYHQSNYLKRNR